ncbi:hypothetical protein [Herpetosiphon geysericola]|uniref:hypothetical protein n=1 Tax=Herpetosiphon geysericola TaxID=70996 RepID=UPI0006C927DA|nr:hypothetical protein [Herpetosiphon geysericola]
MTTGNAWVDAIGQLPIEGNIVPPAWFQHITFENGKPHACAVILLSDIVYWYRPTILRNETTGHVTGSRKKFRADMLQRSYDNFADQYGFTKAQVKAGINALVEKGLIVREFRSETVNGQRLTNLLYVAPIAHAIAKISTPLCDSNAIPPSTESHTSPNRMAEVGDSNDTPPPTESQTNTTTTQRLPKDFPTTSTPASHDANDDVVVVEKPSRRSQVATETYLLLRNHNPPIGAAREFAHEDYAQVKAYLAHADAAGYHPAQIVENLRAGLHRQPAAQPAATEPAQPTEPLPDWPTWLPANHGLPAEMVAWMQQAIWVEERGEIEIPKHNERFRRRFSYWLTPLEADLRGIYATH